MSIGRLASKLMVNRENGSILNRHSIAVVRLFQTHFNKQ